MAGLIFVCLFFREFYVINGSISVFMRFWGAISNFVYTYSFATLISRLSSVFILSNRGYEMCRTRIEFEQKLFAIMRLLYIKLIWKKRSASLPKF